MKCIIGIDGGGTKTYAKAYDLAGNFLAGAKSGSSNLCSNTDEVVKENMRQLFGQLYAAYPSLQPVSICMGTAGVTASDAKGRIKAFITSQSSCENVLVVGDMELPVFAHDSEKNAVAIISGTGSIVFARNKNGACARVGGWGHIVGDEGSGYWLTVQGMKEVMREFDGRGKQTLLTDLLLSHLGYTSPQEMITLIHGDFNKSQLASMAYLLDVAAKSGDEVAISILNNGAELLLEMLHAAIKAADFTGDFAVIFIGGVLQKSEMINAKVRAVIRERYPLAEVTDQRKEAVDCAVDIAKKLA